MTTDKPGRPAIKPGARGGVRAVKRGSSWYCRVRYRDLEGNPHQFNVQAMTKTSCEDAAHERWAEIKRALTRASSVLPNNAIGAIAEKWFMSLEKRVAAKTLAPGTLFQYRACWKGTLAPVVADWDVNECTRAQLQELVHEGLFRRSQKGEYVIDTDGERTPLVGTQARQVLLLVLEFAADRGYRRDGLNPLAGTKRPVHLRPKELERTLTDDEWDQLLEMSRVASLRPRAAKHLYRTLGVIYYTGARIGESVGLVREKIDLVEPPTVLINEQLPESYRVSDTNPLVPTKGEDLRMVIAVPELAAILIEAMGNSKFTDPSSPLYPTKNGTFPTHANVRTMLRDLVDGTELSWVHPHALRRTYLTNATRLLGLDAAADLGGHLDKRVTKKHYAFVKDMLVLDPRALFAKAPDEAQNDDPGD